MPRAAWNRISAGCLAASVVFAGVLGTRDACADEPIEPEKNTNPSVLPASSARPNLILVGAAITAGWYGASYGMSYLWPDSDGAEPLRIPVAGPYMALAKTGCSDRETSCGTFTLVLRTILTGLAAVGQTGGVLAMVEGVFVQTSSTRERPSRAAAASPTFHFTPFVGGAPPVPADRRAAAAPFMRSPSPTAEAVGFGLSGNF